uniref:Plastid lipid-associated protein/fibrillin conserved domain-containing protein n=1 Tax=Kalanchoe fedtschenkoi TaxID=63787 RepID=A0A7N0UKC8_KALFE
MATFLPTSPFLLLLRSPNTAAARPTLHFRSSPQPLHRMSTSTPKSLILNPKPTSTRIHSTISDNDSDCEPDVPDSKFNIVDEWGEKAEPEPESAYTNFTDRDPVKDEDEWGADDFGNGRVTEAVAESVKEVAESVKEVADERIGDLKRALVDTVYGTNLGFGANVEVRAEVLELVSQLEAANPTPAPVEAAELLGGNWVLV